MDLSKSKFKVLKVPELPIVDMDVIEFINYLPDKEHLDLLGSGQYTLEDGAVFAADEDVDLETYDEILNKYDPADPFEVEKAHAALEAAGYEKIGDACVCSFLKRGKKDTEYILALVLNKKEMVVIASSSSKSLLLSYKELIDNPMTRFKLGMVLNTHPERVTDIAEYNKGILDEFKEEEEALRKLNL